jgi:hypothetical protein
MGMMRAGGAITFDDIQRWVMQARPGTSIQIVSIQVPPDAHPAMEICGDVDEGETPWTADQVVEWVRREYGDAGLKPREWSALLQGISVRELRLAVQAGSIRHHRKAEGRDHGAYLIGPDAMCGYLQSRPGAEVGPPAPRGESR